jgi:hypothetical protein
MDFLSSNIIVGLPALVGVLLGIKLYLTGFSLIFYILLLLGIDFIALNTGSFLMSRSPRFAGLLIELWILSAIAVTALTTAGIFWLTFSEPLNFIGNTAVLSAQQIKEISAVLISAVTAYAALAWTKNIEDADGYFWPSTQFKKAIQAVYDELPDKPLNDTKVYEAMFLDTVRDYGPIGWDFAARRIRARVLAGFL